MNLIPSRLVLDVEAGATLVKYVYNTTCSGCGLLRPHARYPPGGVGGDGDGSFDFIAMAIHVDRLGGADDAVLVGMRVHRLLCEEGPREDITRGAEESGDTDSFRHHGAS